MDLYKMLKKLGNRLLKRSQAFHNHESQIALSALMVSHHSEHLKDLWDLYFKYVGLPEIYM